MFLIGAVPDLSWYGRHKESVPYLLTSYLLYLRLLVDKNHNRGNSSALKKKWYVLHTWIILISHDWDKQWTTGSKHKNQTQTFNLVKHNNFRLTLNE